MEYFKILEINKSDESLAIHYCKKISETKVQTENGEKTYTDFWKISNEYTWCKVFSKENKNLDELEVRTSTEEEYTSQALEYIRQKEERNESDRRDIEKRKSEIAEIKGTIKK